MGVGAALWALVPGVEAPTTPASVDVALPVAGPPAQDDGAAAFSVGTDRYGFDWSTRGEVTVPMGEGQSVVVSSRLTGELYITTESVSEAAVVQRAAIVSLTDV